MAQEYSDYLNHAVIYSFHRSVRDFVAVSCDSRRNSFFSATGSGQVE